MSEEIDFTDSGLASVDDPRSQSAVASSGLSGLSSPAAPVLHRAASSKAPREPTVFACDKARCKKTYKTKSGFEKHRLAHLVSDAYGRMPTQEDFSSVINKLMLNVLKKLLEEHRIGSDAELKVKFVEELLTKKLDDASWTVFVSALSSPLFQCLSEPSKLMPQNRYQEAQQKLNHALNNETAMFDLSQQLQFVSDNVDVSDSLARKLVFRMAFLLMEQIQVFIAKEMQGSGSSSVACFQSHNISDVEKEEFKVLGSLLRSFARKGFRKEASSKMWRSVCRCLKESFIEDKVNSEQFLDKKLWHSTEDSENAIVISKTTLDFFFFVETVVRLPAQEGDLLKFNSLDDVLSLILNNRGAMELWFRFSHNYFAEEDSLYVMKLFVSAFRELSIRLEEKLRSSQALEKGRSCFALRTNLKRD